jgi:flavorubredoxin
VALVYVIYHSDTGSTHRLAELIAEGAGSAGAEVKLVSAEDLDYAAAAKAAGYAIGSPDYFSYVAGQVKTFFDSVLYDERFKGKPCVAFGTHGGGGKVLDVLNQLCKSVGLKAIGPGLQTKGRPGPGDTDVAHKLGKALAEAAAGRKA